MGVEDIVLVDDDRVIQKMVGGFLERKGYHVRKASDGIEALQLVHERVPDLIITDVRMPELKASSWPTAFVATTEQPACRSSCSPRWRSARCSRRLRGGRRRLPAQALRADDPRSQGSSHAAARGGNERQGEPGKVILFAHAKGGVGTTSLAVNIAVLLAAKASRPVGLLDLDVEFGDSAVYLNLHPNQTLADLKASPGAPVDEALFEGFVTESGSVRLVVGADSPERAELVTLPAIQLAIDRLSATCQYVLIDSPASFSERTLTALDTSDLICLITSASLPSLKATQRCLDLFDKIGVDSGRVR